MEWTEKINFVFSCLLATELMSSAGAKNLQNTKSLPGMKNKRVG
jgi:hypothetical protein